MKHRIGESAADIDVLLDRLAGSERASLAQFLWNGGMAAIIGLGLPLFLIVMLVRERTHDSTWWLAVAVAVAAPVCAYEVVVNTLATYVMTRDAISRVSPFGLGSWRIERADICAIDLELSSHGPVLHIVPGSGRTRSLLLLPGFHERLARLYPEIGRPGASIELSRGFGRVMYALLAIVVTLFIAVLMITWD